MQEECKVHEDYEGPLMINFDPHNSKKAMKHRKDQVSDELFIFCNDT